MPDTRLRELVAKWRKFAPKTQSYVAYAIRECADELESALNAQAAVETQSEYCQKCHKMIMQPNVSYGVNPDAVCRCDSPVRGSDGGGWPITSVPTLRIARWHGSRPPDPEPKRE